MSKTYTQLHVHFVFAVKGRASLVQEHFRERLEKFISAIVLKRNHTLLAIYCMPDHIHIFIGKRPNQSESDLVRDIKTNSTAFINEERLVHGQFAWQSGFGAFSHSKSQVDRVIAYIRNQPNHHKRKSFKKEYIKIASAYGSGEDAQNAFQWIEE